MATQSLVTRYSGNPILTREDIPYPVETVHNAAAVKYGKEYLQNEDDFYTDLTQIFENDKRIVYSDNCCHFNIAGNHVIARAIGDRVRERLAVKRD